MTKVTIIGEEAKKCKYSKIKFIKALTADYKITNTNAEPSDFPHIELICRDYSTMGGMDLMFAYYDPKERSLGTLMLGYFNDGIV